MRVFPLAVLVRILALLWWFVLLISSTLVPDDGIRYSLFDDCAFFVIDNLGSVFEVTNRGVHLVGVLAVLNKVNGSLDLWTHGSREILSSLGSEKCYEENVGLSGE